MDFFKLVLRIMLKLIPDACHKGHEITKVLSKKRPELFPKYRDIFALVKSLTTLILHLSEGNTPTKEKSSKRDTIGPSGPSNIKMIFAILAKVLTVYI